METVEVLLFASLREALGRDLLRIEVPAGITAAEFLIRVAESEPTLRERLVSVRVAVDHQFLEPTALVLPAREIALIPPVSGG